jgi:hypothetical protein
VLNGEKRSTGRGACRNGMLAGVGRRAFHIWPYRNVAWQTGREGTCVAVIGHDGRDPEASKIGFIFASMLDRRRRNAYCSEVSMLAVKIKTEGLKCLLRNQFQLDGKINST